jgi:hypothetical protein
LAVGSYELPKSRDSNQDNFGTISGLQLGSPKKKNHLDVASAERCRVNPLWGGRQQPHQSLEKLRKYKGGEQAPRNGSLALPKDAAVKPFSPKGKLNAILIVLSPILARRSNGLPGGHAHLRRSLPRLEQDPFEGVLAIKVPSASFGP